MSKVKEHMAADDYDGPSMQAASEAVVRTIRRLRQAAGIMLNYTTATQDIREELGTAVHEAAHTIATLTAQLAAAESKAAAMRQALEVYADSCDVAGTSQDCGYETHLCCMTARAALRAEEMAK